MYIGIDAGGTKTDVCICNIDGKITARSIFEGINAARTGAEAAAANIASAIRVLGGANARALYAGIAGAGSAAISGPIAELLRRELPEIEIINVNSDAFNALNGQVALGDGVALIAGTGSCAFVRTNGDIRQIGGRGYLIDDAGSGYWVGRACLNAAYRALDGRGPQTALVPALESAIGAPLGLAIPQIYDGGASYISSLAPLAFSCAEAGDAVAKDISEACARELALHLNAAAADNCPRLCVASGGMFKSQLLRDTLSRLTAALPMEICYPASPPVYGAVMTAAAYAGKSSIYIRE